MSITFQKRQKEMKRQEKQRMKEERRAQKKLEKRAKAQGTEDGTTVNPSAEQDAERAKTFEEQIALGGEPTCRRRIVIKNQHFHPITPSIHDLTSSGELKHQNASTLGSARASQLSGKKP